MRSQLPEIPWGSVLLQMKSHNLPDSRQKKIKLLQDNPWKLIGGWLFKWKWERDQSRWSGKKIETRKLVCQSLKITWEDWPQQVSVTRRVSNVNLSKTENRKRQARTRKSNGGDWPNQLSVGSIKQHARCITTSRQVKIYLYKYYLIVSFSGKERW